VADPTGAPAKPTFFAAPAEFRAWLEEHHATARELWVGYHRKGTGRPSITWPESVDQALCFGWIDGIRKSVDDASYMIRFTPRRARSTWSAVNVMRVVELTELGLMRPAGLRAFEERTDEKTGIYSYEQARTAELDAAHEERFRAHEPAWEFFQAQPAWYRRAATRWVASAKKEETRLRRLATLIEDSAHGRTIAPLTRRSGRG
jgi:uncharacterized protein YdeI (YjbR/CyaY-like superfamily)